jgi:hypothetical protein
MKRYELAQIETNQNKTNKLRPYVGRLTAKAAIGLTLLGAGAAEATPVAAQPERTSSSAIVKGLKKLNHLKVNDTLRVLQGHTGGLVIDRKTVLHKLSRGKLVETTSPVGTLPVYHAAYEQDGKNKLAFFKYDNVSYEMSLTDKRNRGHITENYLRSHDINDPNAIDKRPLNLKDISSSVVPVNNIEDGRYYTDKGAEHDFYATETVSNGDYKTQVRIAQAEPIIID